MLRAVLHSPAHAGSGVGVHEGLTSGPDGAVCPLEGGRREEKEVSEFTTKPSLPCILFE